MKYNFCVYIHSNKFNYVPTMVSKHSFLKENEGLDVYVETLEEHEKLLTYHNSIFYRDEKKLQWDSTKHQAFFPVRFLCVEAHKNKNRNNRWILVVDPDIFCLKNINVLNEFIKKAEKENISIISHKNQSSMMLLDTTKIDWTEDEIVDSMFIQKNNFNDWMRLRKNRTLNIPSSFNEKDKIKKDTYLLHTTCTETQPWKTGIKYSESELHNKIKRTNEKLLQFEEHPSKQVKQKVFSLFFEAYNKKIITKDEIEMAIENKNIRSDILKVIKETQTKD
jgi:hypothetical protein